MARRRLIPFLFVGAIFSMGASYRTQNFVVEAATPEIARQVGDYAEQYRREKARLWLLREMPPWSQPCPLKATVTMGGSGGATSFAFDNGQVLGQRMHIEGTLDRLLASVLPHEVTHTVFAFHFRQPVPRWADEGGSVLSEDEQERRRHDLLVRRIINDGRMIPLRRLFSLREYPSDVMALYAQGFSVSEFLVSRSSRPAFLNFVYTGMAQGWDQAARAHYGFNSVEELEQAWIQYLRSPKQAPPAQVASAGATLRSPTAEQVVVRQTAPPAQPLQDFAGARPVYRGQLPSPEDAPVQPFRPTSMSAPGGLSPAPSGQPPRAQLLAPEYVTPQGAPAVLPSGPQ
jgi:hypothetical protein